jgi:hypothetical protein
MIPLDCVLKSLYVCICNQIKDFKIMLFIASHLFPMYIHVPLFVGFNFSGSMAKEKILVRK